MIESYDPTAITAVNPPPPPQYRPSDDRIPQYCRWFSSPEYVFLGYI